MERRRDRLELGQGEVGLGVVGRNGDPASPLVNVPDEPDHLGLHRPHERDKGRLIGELGPHPRLDLKLAIVEHGVNADQGRVEVLRGAWLPVGVERPLIVTGNVAHVVERQPHRPGTLDLDKPPGHAMGGDGQEFLPGQEKLLDAVLARVERHRVAGREPSDGASSVG